MEEKETEEKKEWRTESYDYQSRQIWPGRGQLILAQYNTDSVVVYQAFPPEIANYGVLHKRFVGCPEYNPLRMTWIKTNFLWMMFRSGWASKPRQERVLAIFVRRERFDYYLKCARKNGSARGETGTVRLQWDPDHFPDGTCHPYRRAVQLGLKGVVSFADGSDIIDIVDVTDFVHVQSPIAKSEAMKGLLVASETLYVPEEKEAVASVGLTLEAPKT